MEINLTIDAYSEDQNTTQLDYQLPADWFCGLVCTKRLLVANNSRNYGSRQRKYSFCVEGMTGPFIFFNLWLVYILNFTSQFFGLHLLRCFQYFSRAFKLLIFQSLFIFVCWTIFKVFCPLGEKVLSSHSFRCQSCYGNIKSNTLHCRCCNSLSFLSIN